MVFVNHQVCCAFRYSRNLASIPRRAYLTSVNLNGLTRELAMPVTTSYPGIYIQELPSSSHSITAAPTNIAVFIGYTHPLKTLKENWGKPVEIFGFMDYRRGFGGFLRSAA